MRIVVNNIAASSGGALSILKSFYNYLKNNEAQKENEWVFLLSDNYIEETDNIKVIVLKDVKKSWINRLKFDLYSGKNIISELKPDVVFSLQNTITFGINCCPQVLYMHQSIPFQKDVKFSFLKSEERILAVYQYIIGNLIKKSIKKSDKTIVQTNWIRDAVIKETKISPNKIISILPPVENMTAYKKQNCLKKNNFFYPAAKNIYKNHKCIYEASELLNKKGVTDFNISLTINSNKSRDNFIYLGIIPFESVMEQYNLSTLIFPSYIETVGLPLIEASQMETIILVADCAYSREVLKNYENAYFFDPFNPEELAILMQKVMTSQIRKLPLNKIVDDSLDGWLAVIEIIEGISGEEK